MAEINFDSLDLDEEEELNFVVGEDTDEQQDLNLCLVGRFVHDRPIRFKSMKACLADVWRLVKGMTVKEATQGLYLFKFFHPLDVEEVLKGGPWTFDNVTLIIDKLKIWVALQDIPLFHVNFWVQIHDVAIGMMLETVGKGLANYIGEFVEYDKNNNTSFWRKYMRVKVRVDVKSLLKTEKKIKLNGDLVMQKISVRKYAMEKDDGWRSWSNEIRVEVRRPGGRVGSRWLHEEGRKKDDVDVSRYSGDRGSHQTGPTQPNVASPRENSRGPNNGEIVSTIRGHIHPLRSSVVRQSSSNQGSAIETPAVLLISNRSILAITNDTTTTIQLTETPSLNEINQVDHEDMDTQVERKRRMAEGLVAAGSEVRTHQHFLSAAIDVEGRSGGLAVFWKDSSIDVEGRSGGLAVFWKDSCKCRMLNYTRNFINMIVEDEQWGEWRLTCYYGYLERSRRRAAWDLLRDLCNMYSIPWCIIGNFNDLLSQTDKKATHPHLNGLCMGFRQAVSDCDLTNIPIERHPFTWIKSRGSPHVIEERLDRVMASTSWLQLYPQVRLSNLLASHSDHSLIFFQCKPTIGTQFKHSFRFENSWLKEPDLEDVVVEGWGGRENLEVVDRVTRCANKLQRWGKKKRVRFKEEIDQCVRRMNEFRGNQDEEVSMQYQELSERHATLLIQEEGYWKQRAKMHWLQEGDMNTRFFHMPATARSKKKKVTKLIADNGTEAHTQEELCEVAKSYFDTLFKQRYGDHDPVLNLIQSQVTDDDNFFLTTPITKVEIQQALFQMHPDKSPGPDEFNPAFYQSSVNYSVLMNYDRVGPILPGRGLRQGDPLSPYLFILVTERLTALIHQVVGRGDLHGVRICRGAPEVSHLLFADDCFLFCRANVAEVNELMRMLHTYEQASGQEINLVKSEVFISRNMSHAAKEYLSRIRGVKLVLDTGIYLGLPSMVGRSKEIMVKSVLQAISSYVMSGGLGVGIMFVLCITLGCVGVLIDGCPRLNQQDASERILETPLVSSVREDKVFWEEERNGCYSVKSGYKLAMRYIISSDKYHVAEWYSVHQVQSNSVSGTTETYMTSVGLCFRDNSGQFMADMTQWQQTVISSVEGEA
ncbi:hypothetical protein TSUD_14120 [Trifolium subterraneum]|uniref:Reverse transcriptase domain-containing protein n=1 Tax=Trifolium subterraneum TaxID=3900 RepID=A0A2Z6PBT0_TRISU|nr:hypothetical protein TSUD_14120 [Trifolium subterraneum]